MTVGDAIKLIRTARKAKQKDLAERLNVAPNYLSMIEAGKRIPSIHFLQALAEQLGVPSGLFLLWAETGHAKLKTSQVRQLRELLVRIQAIYLEDKADDSAAYV